jgi:hypothetical protein
VVTATAAAVVAVPVLALLPVALGWPYPVAVAVALVLVLLPAVALLRRPAEPAGPSGAGNTGGAGTTDGARGTNGTDGAGGTNGTDGARALADPLLTVATAVLVAALVPALDWSAADRTASLVALAACAVLGTALARRLRPTGPVGAAAAVGTVLALGAEAAAATDTAGLPTPVVLLSVLAVAVAAAPVAAALRPAARLSRAVEGAGYGLAALALARLTPYPEPLVLGLSATAVTALGVALRADRRPAAGYAGTGLALLASWVQLALWHVHTPEPYSLPLAAVALAIGTARVRRVPATSSWVAHGPGLAAGLLPSVLALWQDGHWLRPLLLGTGALAVTLVGVRLRLQALLVLGGAALLAAAGHELAPAVVQVIGLLPRWVPPATAGLLLLALGARYEHRLHDARRLRRTLRQFR